FNKNNVRIQLQSVKGFKDKLVRRKLLKSELVARNVQHFTFTLKDEKALPMVLKGLPPCSEEEVLQEIKAQGLNLLACYKLKDTNTFRVNFAPGTTPQHINQIRFLFRTKIYWDRFMSRTTHTQCYRYQAFGHTSSNCNLQPACPYEVTPTCANCKGPHTANFRECPALNRYLKNDNIPSPRADPNSLDVPRTVKSGLRNQVLEVKVVDVTGTAYAGDPHHRAPGQANLMPIGFWTIVRRDPVDTRIQSRIDSQPHKDNLN
ncbi:uncharacterized protein LOC144477767, partial [Augochlora pura]